MCDDSGQCKKFVHVVLLKNAGRGLDKGAVDHGRMTTLYNVKFLYILYICLIDNRSKETESDLEYIFVNI
jgi:hypothetical protein